MKSTLDFLGSTLWCKIKCLVWCAADQNLSGYLIMKAMMGCVIPIIQHFALYTVWWVYITHWRVISIESILLKWKTQESLLIFSLLLKHTCMWWDIKLICMFLRVIFCTVMVIIPIHKEFMSPLFWLWNCSNMCFASNMCSSCAVRCWTYPVHCLAWDTNIYKEWRRLCWLWSDYSRG
jgi:hypothetical protein